jgi:hypothetical protein
MLSDGRDGSPRSLPARWASLRYENIEYCCTRCGHEWTADGLPIKVRSPMLDEADCSICTMEIVNARMYWSGWVAPDEVVFHA